ncbi:MAG: urease accessory UreF family protein, partial [Ketobacteraceae bacterium]|nr:urease accessory UreF family protein [Ketobacteraceae bacterium]
LTSPSLPIGGFSWSQGLEYAIDAGWLKNEADTRAWLQGLIVNSLANLDVPVLCRLHAAAAASCADSMKQWNEIILASRETSELYLEDTQMGAALRRLLLDLGFFTEADFPEADISYLTGFAMAAVSKGVNSQSACIGFMWSWLENQIAATLKAFPLGQTAGQRIFHGLADDVVNAVQYGMALDDEQIGNSMPGQIMASMLHEEQYSRLFRS